jgi:hypothetical protein
MNTSFHETKVELSESNYDIIDTSVNGEARASYLLGVSYGMGMSGSSLALIPLNSDRALYKSAIENLWKNFREKHGAPKGRQLALVNVRYDAEALNTIVYTHLDINVVADVVEFTE